jgi:CHASE2 domain-containing sensor protein
VFALVAGMRELGLLQSVEFLAYDKFLTWRAGENTTDPGIVIVEITEEDIAKYDFLRVNGTVPNSDRTINIRAS